MNSINQAGNLNTLEAEKAIRELNQQLYEAWGRGDADAYAALFTEEADYVLFDGTHLKGRVAIAESHRPLFKRFMKGSRLVGELTALRFLSSDVALVHTRGAIMMSFQKKPSPRRQSVQTLVAVKRGDRWLFAAFQNTRYRPWDKTLFGRIIKLFAR